MKPNSVAVLGLQWGDEGKGKIIDYLSENSDVVARFGGGANAGHTIVVQGEKFILRLIPSGILHKGKLCLIGPGVACDPEVLQNEISELEKRGISTAERLFVDYASHLVLPVHRFADGYRDSERGDGAIDTTRRGIGPSYADRASRVGIRVADIFDRQQLSLKIKYLIAEHMDCLEGLGDEALVDQTRLTQNLSQFEPLLKKLVADVGPKIMEQLLAGKKVLFEGAQGALLDIDFGTYPYVTSSHTTIGGIFTGLGIPPSMLSETVGVTKAYMTRVGHGPFPSELDGELAEKLRESGNEYGSVTGRPRRVGWLDLAALVRVIRQNGVTRLAVTKLDVLDGLDDIFVCESYQLDSAGTMVIPPNHPDFVRAKPVLKKFKGWSKSTADATRLDQLPSEARKYLDYIAEKTGVPIWLISTGQSRESTIIIE